MQRRSDQRDLLGHTSRVGREDRVAAVREVEAFEKLGDALGADACRHAIQISEVVEVLDRGIAAVQPRLVGHHAEPGANLVELFRQRKAVELDQAGVRPQDSAETSQGRGLARAVLAEQHQDLPALDVNVHAVDGAYITKALAKALDPDHWTKQSRLR